MKPWFYLFFLYNPCGKYCVITLIFNNHNSCTIYCTYAHWYIQVLQQNVYRSGTLLWIGVCTVQDDCVACSKFWTHVCGWFIIGLSYWKHPSWLNGGRWGRVSLTFPPKVGALFMVVGGTYGLSLPLWGFLCDSKVEIFLYHEMTFA